MRIYETRERFGNTAAIAERLERARFFIGDDEVGAGGLVFEDHEGILSRSGFRFGSERKKGLSE